MSHKVVSLGFCIVDLIAGISFGIFGHFFGLFCFPFLGMLRGVLFELFKTKELDLKHYFVNSIFGAFAYYIGIMFGGIILITLLVPNSQAMQNFMDGALSTTEGKIGGFIGIVICGIAYMFVYSLSSIIASFATKMVSGGKPNTVQESP
jgi:hypothetical protein